ncbi:hypothetical protein ACJMK2_030317 [Sinanodonta woodiana]|uniref:Integrase zinc-binding domain-containing protein n=1 Tax=Sinanodonta woodiana TaxID=1069815 RepID=A0ABD3XGM0_SINWO
MEDVEEASNFNAARRIKHQSIGKKQTKVKAIARLLRKFQNVFSRDDNDLGSGQAEGPESPDQQTATLRGVKTLYQAKTKEKANQEKEKVEVDTSREELRSTRDLCIPWGNYDIQKLRKLQEADEDIGPILSARLKNTRPTGTSMATTSPVSRHYWLLWDSLAVIEGVLFKKLFRRDGTEKYLQFIVPRVLKGEIMYQIHNTVLSGHLGCRKTCEKTLQRFYWYEMREDISNWIKRCDICAADKGLNRKPRASLRSMGVGSPMDRLASDVLTSIYC